MAVVGLLPSVAAGVVCDEFVVGFVDQDGVERREPLGGCVMAPFEVASPVRSFPSFRGQRNWPGLWWSASMRAHVGYESWLERDHAMLLDFDSQIRTFSSQPFWLFFGEGGRDRAHAPDFFARRVDGGAVVIDCRPDGRIRTRDAAAFAATARACAVAGWEYRRVGAAEPVLVENVRWLAGYRQPRFANPVTAERLQAIFAVSRTLLEGAELAGPAMAVLPVLFHLLWCGRLRTDLSVPLSDSSIVRAVVP